MTPLPFPPHLQQRVPPIAGGGSALSKKQDGEGPSGFRMSMVSLGLSLRGTAALIEAKLATSVHPNPGPGARRGRRGRGEGRRSGRRERRYERRRERARERRRGTGRTNDGMNERMIVTWNVQGMSVRENNRERMRRVVGKVVHEGWEIVCLTELRAESEGVVWLGDDECRVVLVHGKRSGVLLRGSAMEKWVEEGQSKWMYERVSAVVFGGMRVVSAYQPVWGTDEEAMNDYRSALESQIAMSGLERLVIAGDFNANVGRGNVREGVCGKYGIGRMNEAGRDLIHWCEWSSVCK